MALSPQVQASLIQVAGDWTRYLQTIEPPRRRRAVLIRMLKRYDLVYQTLLKKFET